MKPSTLAVAVIAYALAAGSADAGVTLFSARTAFVAATGPAMTLETFNSFQAEASFATTSLVIGQLTFAGFGHQAGGNIIDLAPHQFEAQNLDGTPNASVTTFPDGGFDITFAHAVKAFGAGFGDLQDRGLRTRVRLLNGLGEIVDVATPPVQQTDGASFFGFISDTAFTTLRFIGTDIDEGDGFAVDDLLFGDPAPVTGGGGGGGEGGGGEGGGPGAGVPEPSTWSLLIGGFGLAGVALRRRRLAAVRPA